MTDAQVVQSRVTLTKRSQEILARLQAKSRTPASAARYVEEGLKLLETEYERSGRRL